MEPQKTTRINRTFNEVTLCVHVPSRPHPEGGSLIAYEDVRAGKIAIASKLLDLGVWTPDVHSFCLEVTGNSTGIMAGMFGRTEEGIRRTDSGEEIRDEDWMHLTETVNRLREEAGRLPSVDILAS